MSSPNSQRAKTADLSGGEEPRGRDFHGGRRQAAFPTGTYTVKSTHCRGTPRRRAKRPSG